ncbi:MAG: hypothetical protein BRC27_01345 [Nanohaloarchaea archaeon SW_10_44_10]|nr:MAG: hypothetical protein BRC27_01345 [Nanohaloarchaea archaeon SW_10_44_10]
MGKRKRNYKNPGKPDESSLQRAQKSRRIQTGVNNMIATVKVRGSIDARHKAKRTLKDLNLEKRNQCVVFEDNDSIRGMLETAKDYITYGEISKETLEKLEERKGSEIESGDTVKLTPPTGGFRNTKKQVGQGGSLGKRDNLDELIQKMV